MKDNHCPGCEKVVSILDGPEEYQYDYSTKRVWHRRCYTKKETNV